MHSLATVYQTHWTYYNGSNWGISTSYTLIQVRQQLYPCYILTALLFPQVSGHVQVSAKCWDTQTDAGAPQLQGPTRAWPVDHICQHSPRQLHFPVTPEGKTTIQFTYLKPMVCKVCMKRFNTRSLIIFLWVRRHQPEYRKQMRYPFQSTQTHKTAYIKDHQKGLCLYTVQCFYPDLLCVGLLQCFVVCICLLIHIRLFIVLCIICKILYINNIFFIMTQCKEEFYYEFSGACVTI